MIKHKINVIFRTESIVYLIVEQASKIGCDCHQIKMLSYAQFCIGIYVWKVVFEIDFRLYSAICRYFFTIPYKDNQIYFL